MHNRRYVRGLLPLMHTPIIFCCLLVLAVAPVWTVCWVACHGPLTIEDDLPLPVAFQKAPSAGSYHLTSITRKLLNSYGAQG